MEIIIFLVCLFSALFGIFGYFFTKKDMNNKGYYYIGGPNGGAGNQFFNKHPNANRLFQAIDTHGLKQWSKKEIEELFSLGAKAIAIDSIGNGLLVITQDMALAYGKPDLKDPTFGTKGQFFTPSYKDFDYRLKEEEIKVPIHHYTTAKKQESVVGKAVAGAVIAGGVGAVVGAVDALNKNIQNKDAVNDHYIMGGSGVFVTYFNFEFGKNIMRLKSVYVSREFADTIDLNQSVYWIIKEICWKCWK